MSKSYISASKRLMIDHKSIIESKLNEKGIHVLLNENDIFKLNALIIGPKNTHKNPVSIHPFLDQFISFKDE